MEATLRAFLDSQRLAIVLENITNLTARRIYWWIIAVFMGITALIFKNYSLLWIGCGIFVLFVATLVLEAFIFYFARTKAERKAERSSRETDLSKDYFFETPWERWVFVHLFLIAMIAGSFVMGRDNSNPKTATYAQIQHYFGSGSKSIVSAGSSFNLFIPYLDKVEDYSANQTVSLQCVGQTQDGKKIRANLSAELALDAEMVPQINSSQNELTDQVQRALKQRFERTVSNFDLFEMPSNLVLEHHTAIDAAEIEELGLRYNGVIAISDIHLFLN